MEYVLAIGLDTISFVLTLVLVTLGLVIIYGMMNVINMAHGELFLLGAYTLATAQSVGVPFWIGILLAAIIVGFVGLVIEELVIRHVYGRPIDTILATWGLSIVIKQIIIILFGPAAVILTNPSPGTVSLAGMEYPIYRLIIMLVSLVLAASVYAVLFRTSLGLQIRGVIANREMAGSLGVNTRMMDRGTFVAGAGLAGVAGAVMAPIMSVDPQMGVGFLIPAFLAVLVGGLNSLLGALVGAGVIGGATTTLSSLFPQATAQIVVFLIAIVVIRRFPLGILKGRMK